MEFSAYDIISLGRKQTNEPAKQTETNKKPKIFLLVKNIYLNQFLDSKRIIANQFLPWTYEHSPAYKQ